MKRNLKIEERGDFYRKNVFPGIRLVGKWLARAGFKPGGRVHVHVLADGILQLEVER